MDGWKAIVLKEKLKAAKLVIRGWNATAFGSIDEKIKDAKRIINELDEKAERGDLSMLEVDLRRQKFADLWHKLRDKESLLRQKSRHRWLVEGDANSSYFHACIAMRRKRNQMASGWRSLA